MRNLTPDLDIVVLEEHYADRALQTLLGRDIGGPLAELLYASPEQRAARLNRLGIATEVLALAPPGLQAFGANDAPAVARAVNGRLAAFVAEAPKRFAGLAALPTAAPSAAADELAHCVESLGLKGAMVHGPTDGRFLDDPVFFPIFERAAALGVPIYVHPSDILAPVREAYFQPYAPTHPMFTRAAWGYTIETGTHAMRLVLSGLFDRLPDLQIVLGHLGEGIPYLLSRIDEALSRDTPMKRFREIFTRNFSVTSSGFFSTPALRCCLEELGRDRVMFSIDAPYASSESGLAWLRSLELAPDAVAAVAGGNSRRMLRL